VKSIHTHALNFAANSIYYSFKSQHTFRKVPKTLAVYTLIADAGRLRPITFCKDRRRLNSASDSSVPHCGTFDSLCVCWIGHA
jgi:hypothetical protein